MLTVNERAQNLETLRHQNEQRLAAAVGRGDAQRYDTHEARLGNSLRLTVKDFLVRLFRKAPKEAPIQEDGIAAPHDWAA